MVNPSENGMKFQNSSQNNINYEIKKFYFFFVMKFIFFFKKKRLRKRNLQKFKRLCVCVFANQISLAKMYKIIIIFERKNGGERERNNFAVNMEKMCQMI